MLTISHFGLPRKVVSWTRSFSLNFYPSCGYHLALALGDMDDVYWESLHTQFGQRRDFPTVQGAICDMCTRVQESREQVCKNISQQEQILAELKAAYDKVLKSPLSHEPGTYEYNQEYALRTEIDGRKSTIELTKGILPYYDILEEDIKSMAKDLDVSFV